MESQKKLYIEKPIKVHTYDTDFMKIVSNTVYPKYFEDLRNAVLDKYLPLEDMLKDHNTPILAETHIYYRHPLTLDNHPIGCCNITLKGASRWEAEIEIVEDGKIFCTGKQMGYYFNLDTNHPTRFPADFLQIYESPKQPNN